MNKKEIRSKSLTLRNSISEVMRAQKSKKIIDQLEELSIYKNAKHILFYYSIGSEVDTIPLINKYVKEKKIYLPKLIGKNKFIALPFHNFDIMNKGEFEIPEPIQREGGETYEGKLDLVIVPGVGFDESGNRIGMGKGFYDRYLSNLPHVKRIALAFEEQMLESIPKDQYDEQVNVIITDENIYNCNL